MALACEIKTTFCVSYGVYHSKIVKKNGLDGFPKEIFVQANVGVYIYGRAPERR